MKKVIRTVDQARGIVQVTIADERFYALPVMDDSTGLPAGYRYVPAVTWIASFYPKGTAYHRWLASQHGWNEAEAVKAAAGNKGSKVHQGCGRLLQGATLAMDEPILSPASGQPEPLSLEEYEACLSFVGWAQEAKPDPLALESVVVSEVHGYAGTLDLLCRIGTDVWLLDLKTSQDVWPEHELQVSAYKHALPSIEARLGLVDRLGLNSVRLGILQVGYLRNQRGWKLTEVEDRFDLFLAAKAIWAYETAGQAPARKDYPMALSLSMPVVVAPKRKKPAKGEAAQTEVST